MKYLDRFLDLCLAVSVIAPSVAIFLQVVYRYVLNDPSSWLDEFAVLAFAWMTMVGAAVSQRTDSHLSIEFFVKWLPARAQAMLYALRMVAVAGVLAVLFWQGLQLTRQMSFIEYPAMEISRGFLFAILPVCTPFMVLYLITSGMPRLAAAWSGKRIFGEPPPA